METVRDSYLNWIKENTLFGNTLNKAIEISSPFVDSSFFQLFLFNINMRRIITSCSHR